MTAVWPSSLKLALFVAIALLFAACAQSQSQNVYRYDEVGKSAAVSFGTVITSREVDIVGKNTGTGGLIGAAAGAGAGSYIGSGDGTAWAVAGGLIIGAIAGAMAEQALADGKGTEYTVTLETGVTLTIVQNKAEGERLLAPGERVIVQNTGGYQRVLPASHLPTQIKRPQGIEVID